MEAHSSADKLLKNLELADKELAKYTQQSNELDAILLKLVRGAKLVQEKPLATLTETAAKLDGDELSKTVLLFNAPFIGGNPQAANP